MKDITDFEDIKLLVDSFYQKVLSDAVIGYIFTDVVQLNWEHHIPVMYNFWETTLLGRVSYKGNPMQVHKGLNIKEKLTSEHFNQWLRLFNETVDEHFQGEKSDLAKQRALSIATMIQIKISQA